MNKPHKNILKWDNYNQKVNALILIVDDEKFLCKQLEKALSQEGYSVLSAFTGKDGLEVAKRESPALVLLDYKLPDTNGLEVLQSLTSLEPYPTTIMMTGYGSIEVAVSAIKLGAYDFIEKPFHIDKLKVITRNALSAIELRRHLIAATNREQEKYGFNSLMGKSKSIKEIIYLLQKLADTDPKTILITGESGTGKGLAARILHYNGVRAEKPLIELNCAAIPETLLESELFGYEAGAFTDAKKMKKGIFELAHGGTIFLDEIGDMGLGLQAKLIKVIEERTFRKIGGTRDIKVDIRVIAATNHDLRELVSKNIFREDLYHRLNVINIKMPPLKERKEDVPLLTDYFVTYFNSEAHRDITYIPEGVRESFLNYHWPGNIRELRNTIERAVLLSEGKQINPRHLQLEEKSKDEIKLEKSEGRMILEIPLDDASLTKIEEKIIREALDLNDWNQKKTAEMLGVTREVLRYRMKKMGLLD
ncbi:MAG: sigma-54-dependent transcriptional response regulator [Candidatus Dadabacteria bacterium CSP1-2]|nr:MAG: sigma-54-dependent transcriptional response regulator [Candidatus Dadabacteria bacterium CSP1-2]